MNLLTGLAIAAGSIYYNREYFYFYPVQTTEISNNDHYIDEVHGLYMQVDNPKGLIIICHGNAGNVFNRIWLMKKWIYLGYDCYCFDYPGFGKSSGSATVKSLEQSSDLTLRENIFRTK